MSKKAVVSLGHDALGYTTMAQLDAVKVTAKALADGRRHLTKITVALSAAAAALHDSGVQNDRVDSLHNGLGKI